MNQFLKNFLFDNMNKDTGKLKMKTYKWVNSFNNQFLVVLNQILVVPNLKMEGSEPKDSKFQTNFW